MWQRVLSLLYIRARFANAVQICWARARVCNGRTAGIAGLTRDLHMLFGLEIKFVIFSSSHAVSAVAILIELNYRHKTSLIDVLEP